MSIEYGGLIPSRQPGSALHFRRLRIYGGNVIADRGNRENRFDTGNGEVQASDMDRLLKVEYPGAIDRELYRSGGCKVIFKGVEVWLYSAGEK